MLSTRRTEIETKQQEQQQQQQQQQQQWKSQKPLTKYKTMNNTIE